MQYRRWSPVPVSETPIERRWLGLPGSLTSALRACGSFRLEVISEGWARLPRDETLRLQLPAGSHGWVRQVVMSVDGLACVAARTTTTRAGVKGAWRLLAQRANRPLGELLYHAGNIRRGPFEYLRSSQVPASIQAPVQPDNARSLTRRSLFMKAHQPLLISECFLAHFLTHQGVALPARLPPRWSPAERLVGGR